MFLDLAMDFMLSFEIYRFGFPTHLNALAWNESNLAKKEAIKSYILPAPVPINQGPQDSPATSKIRNSPKLEVSHLWHCTVWVECVEWKYT